MMHLKFTKMHGLGNDFVVIDNLDNLRAKSTRNNPEKNNLEKKNNTALPTPEQIRQLANRRLGIGFDQLLLLESDSSSDENTINCRIFNADGQEVAQCGNGMRCVALYLKRQGYMSAQDIGIRTAKGRLKLTFSENNQVTVAMGMPQFRPEDIPLNLAVPHERNQRYRFTLALTDAGIPVCFTALSIGNPHMVIESNDVAQEPLVAHAAKLQCSPFFPEGVNVGFMQILHRGEIKLRVCERGAGETPACGSGACAAVVAGILQGKLDADVTVQLTGGALYVSWQGERKPVYLRGPATHVYEGAIEWNA